MRDFNWPLGQDAHVNHIIVVGQFTDTLESEENGTCLLRYVEEIIFKPSIIFPKHLIKDHIHGAIQEQPKVTHLISILFHGKVKSLFSIYGNPEKQMQTPIIVWLQWFGFSAKSFNEIHRNAKSTYSPTSVDVFQHLSKWKHFCIQWEQCSQNYIELVFKIEVWFKFIIYNSVKFNCVIKRYIAFANFIAILNKDGIYDRRNFCL